eukprot:RCo048725
MHTRPRLQYRECGNPQTKSESIRKKPAIKTTSDSPLIYNLQSFDGSYAGAKAIGRYSGEGPRASSVGHHGGQQGGGHQGGGRDGRGRGGNPGVGAGSSPCGEGLGKDREGLLGQGDANLHRLRGLADLNPVHIGAKGASSAGREVLQEVPGGTVTADAAVHHAVQEGVPTQAVGAVHTPGTLSGGEQPLDNVTLLVDHTALGVHLNAGHAVVHNRGDDRDVELVVHLERHGGEEALGELVRLGLSALVVLVEGSLQLGRWDAHVLRQIISVVVLLHHPATGVVLAVPRDLPGGLAVEDQAVRGLVVLPHAARHEVPFLQLIDESAALLVQQKPSNPAKRLRGQEQVLLIGLVGENETGRVHLNLVHVHQAAAQLSGHLEAIPSAVLAVAGRQGQNRGPLAGPELAVGVGLRKEGVCGEVGAEAPRGQHHRPVLVELLAVLADEGDSDNLALLLDQLNCSGAGQDSGAVGLLLRDLLQALDQTVGDREPRETLPPSVAAGGRGPSHQPHRVEVQVVLVAEPLHRCGTLVGQGVHQGGPHAVARALCSVLLKALWGVLDPQRALLLGVRCVDTPGGLHGVASQKGHLVHHQHPPSTLKHCVSGGVPGQPASNHNNLGHCSAKSRETLQRGEKMIT